MWHCEWVIFYEQKLPNLNFDSKTPFSLQVQFVKMVDYFPSSFSSNATQIFSSPSEPGSNVKLILIPSRTYAQEVVQTSLEVVVDPHAPLDLSCKTPGIYTTILIAWLIVDEPEKGCKSLKAHSQPGSHIRSDAL